MLQSKEAPSPRLLSQYSGACKLQLLSPRAAAPEAWAPTAHAPQQEKPPQWEACVPQLEKQPGLSTAENKCIFKKQLKLHVNQ